MWCFPPGNDTASPYDDLHNVMRGGAGLTRQLSNVTKQSPEATGLGVLLLYD
jgi:hypothetical protein